MSKKKKKKKKKYSFMSKAKLKKNKVNKGIWCISKNNEIKAIFNI